MNKFSKISPYIPNAATLLAAVLLGLSGAKFISVLLPTISDQSKVIPDNSTQYSAKQTDIKVDYNKLINFHLLGKAESKADQKSLKQDILKAPETNLDLKLIGVLFDRKNEDGYAIISESGKPQKTFHKGDELPGNATLYSVESNKVILERNGRHETLSLLKPDINAERPPSRSTRSTDTPMQMREKPRNIDKRSLPEMPESVFSKTGRKF